MTTDPSAPIVPPMCPRCGNVAATRMTQYGLRHECCGLWSWRGKPLATAEMHLARREAHAAFDPIWEGGEVTRTRAYHALSKVLGIDGKDCHISTMPLELLKRIPELVGRVRDRALFPPKPETVARRAWALRLPKCACGNALSKKRVAEGVVTCPPCDERSP